MEDRLLVELVEKRKFLVKTIKEMTSFLREAPEGRLRCTKKGGRAEYYLITEKGDTKGKYIHKSDQGLAALLAQKSYDQKILKMVKIELTRVDNLINIIRSHDLVGLYAHLPEMRKELVNPIYLPDEEYVKQWKDRQYDRLEFKEDEAEFYTLADERVRSKVEILIANMMYQKKIPYHYEVPVKLVRLGIVFCDFEGLNVKKRRTMYHEHFGMMDDPEYCERALRKISDYQRSGYHLGENFIATFESKKQPLDMRLLEKLMDHYYL